MREAIQEAIADNPVILFMKGTPEAPACGFSARTVAILQAVGRQVRGRRHPARPGDPPGAVGNLELADDPTTVRRRRADRRLRHRHRDVRDGRARAGARARGRAGRRGPQRQPRSGRRRCRSRTGFSRQPRSPGPWSTGRSSRSGLTMGALGARPDAAPVARGRARAARRERRRGRRSSGSRSAARR